MGVTIAEERLIAILKEIVDIWDNGDADYLYDPIAKARKILEALDDDA